MAPEHLITAIRAALDETERIAMAAATSIAEHTFAPIDAEMRSPSTRHWEDVRFLFHKRVQAGGNSNAKVTDSVWTEVAEHIAHNDPAAVLRLVAALRELLALAENMQGGDPYQEGMYASRLLPLLAYGLGINPEEETPQ